MANSLSKKHTYGPARSAVIRCADVTSKTTLLLFRVRNVIEAKKGGNQLVAEEMLIWGGQAAQKKATGSARIRPGIFSIMPYQVLIFHPRPGKGFWRTNLKK